MTPSMNSGTVETHQTLVETIAGRANLIWDHPPNAGPIGVTGSNSANAMAVDADVVICVAPITGFYDWVLDMFFRQGNWFCESRAV